MSVGLGLDILGTISSPFDFIIKRGYFLVVADDFEVSVVQAEKLRR